MEVKCGIYVLLGKMRERERDKWKEEKRVPTRAADTRLITPYPVYWATDSTPESTAMSKLMNFIMW